MKRSFIFCFLLHLLLPGLLRAQQVNADPAIGQGRFVSGTPAGFYPQNTGYAISVNVKNMAGATAIPPNAFAVVVQLGRGVKFAGSVSSLSSNYNWTVDSLIDPTQAIVRGVLKTTVPASYNEDLSFPVQTVSGCNNNSQLLSGLNVNAAIIVNGNDFMNDDAAYQYSVFIPIVPGCVGGNTQIGTCVRGIGYQWQKNDGSGYINVTDNGMYSGATTDTLIIQNAPGSLAGTRFRCQVQTGSANAYSAEQEMRFENRWNGQNNTDWDNPINWDCGSLPDVHTDVKINSGAVIVNTNAVCRTLAARPGVIVTVKSGYNLTVVSQ